MHLAKNIKDNLGRPIYTVKTRGNKTPRYATQVHIDGPSSLVYTGKQLSCGARAWVETDADISLENETTFAEIKAKYG